MAAPFLPPGIKAKASRVRIPVSDEERTAARAGMGGEKSAKAKQAAADTPTSPELVAPMATESAAPDVAPTQPAAPVAAEQVAPAIEAAPVVATAADAVPTPAPTVAAAPAPAPVTTEPMPAPAVATEPAAPTKSAQPTATAAPARRGRKPMAVAPGSAPVVLRSLKVPEGSWLEIKVVVAQLSAVEDVPHNIQTYVEAAHKHYEAYLRKQGKLPAK